MIQVRRLGHATLTTPDLERAIAYYADVVGLTVIARAGDRAFLATRQGMEAIALEHGAPNALKRLTFQIAPGSDLAAAAHALAEDGIRSERRSGISPGVAEALVFTDPTTTSAWCGDPGATSSATTSRSITAMPTRCGSSSSPRWTR
jgi:catechol 2,3-dioxygenase-like lactoylglutathione lyase family enzyme